MGCKGDENNDRKVFIYCKDTVYESKMKLYEIEDEFEIMGVKL